MSVFKDAAELTGRTYRLLREHAELLRQIGLPVHAGDMERLAEQHMKLCLELLETTDPGDD